VRDAIGALLALGVELGAGVADAGLALGGLLLGERERPQALHACPRFGISTISVTPTLRFLTPTLRFCFSNEAFTIAGGTKLSVSPEISRSGPRSGLSESTFALVHG
jgi:hypothetical protein